MLLSVILASCIGEQKYTYEEYKKLKAMNADKSSEAITGDLLADDDTGSAESQSYSGDLNDYYLYIGEFRSIYDRYTNELFALFDSFDDEKEDIDKKNQYAGSIIDLEENWITDLEELEVPDFLEDYHIYFIEFLNNEILFYKYFLETDLEKADSSALEADNAYENSLIELELVEKSFNDRAEKLKIESPF